MGVVLLLWSVCHVRPWVTSEVPYDLQVPTLSAMPVGARHGGGAESDLLGTTYKCFFTAGHGLAVFRFLKT